MKTLILAAGKGTRMKSKYPKVMHKVMGIPMLNWVIDRANEVSEDVGVVLGHGIEMVKEIVPNNIKIFEQIGMKGTGHAVMAAEEFLEGDNTLILYGDVPLISNKTLNNLLSKHKNEDNDATLLTIKLKNPFGYGRVIRENNKFKKIVEHKDANEKELIINEINTGIAIYKTEKLREALKKINTNNAQGEYYLTDTFLYFNKVGIFETNDEFEVSGINDRVQLSIIENEARKRHLKNLMKSGVTIIDPSSTYIDYGVKIGQDTIIHPQTYIYGKTIIGNECEIGPMTRVKDCTIMNNVKVLRSECEGAEIYNDVSVGPFTRLRTGAVLKSKVKIGNFVEIKKSTLEEGVKAGHLTYLGDAHIGEKTNIGAGTITCNYDGKNKFKTSIGKNAFIGSNASLVAPVKIGENVITAAGSVITEDVPDNSLAFGRARQIVKKDWVLKKMKGE
ncbi:bifunctional protein GlmU [Tepiditoga spiralis]|uniref:Bifunctional protein GlmU n=1 Tax=Tepiditoga spiralis TaxID=2108365 RepID=A0A7G1G5C8_9BACT|nr:bifunctional UDP-N-acetylglucosamine diphosphorylase/glucosamine-1-phosphate N-acetyltransferase GlmU [Tepiditoga spiralis]BBE30476.1 bifunctional protein GlmU [Tepiditoga spiralis]